MATERKLIPCYICETMFPQYRPSSKFCSLKCRQKGQKERDKVEIQCAHCPVRFIPTVAHGKYCSPECPDAFKRSKQLRPLQNKNCEECGTSYLPITGSARYCSFGCKSVVRKRTRDKSRATEKSKATVSAYNKTYKRFPDKRSMRNRNLIACYGITIETFEQMLEDQNGLCAICEKPPPEGMPLFVDHVHDETAKVRGLLCINCNNLLGQAKESLRIIDNAKHYMIKHGITYDTPEVS